jgi:hypothetical protein
MRVSRGKWIASKRDVWSLDYTLNPIIHAGLVKFKKELLKSSFSGVPADFCIDDDCTDESVANWHETLDKMIYAFDSSKHPDIRDYDFKINFERFPTENKDRTHVVTSCTNDEDRERYHKDCREHEEKCQLGRELFARYYKNLWI